MLKLFQFFKRSEENATNLNITKFTLWRDESFCQNKDDNIIAKRMNMNLFYRGIFKVQTERKLKLQSRIGDIWLEVPT